jgi:hypothetical protein
MDPSNRYGGKSYLLTTLLIKWIWVNCGCMHVDVYKTEYEGIPGAGMTRKRKIPSEAAKHPNEG